MRRKILALAAAVALGTAMTTSGAMAFGHGGGGGFHGGGGGFHGGMAAGGFHGNAAVGGFRGNAVAGHYGAYGGNWGHGNWNRGGWGRGYGWSGYGWGPGVALGLGLGGLYAFGGYPYGYCGDPYYGYAYDCGPYDYGW